MGIDPGQVLGSILPKKLSDGLPKWHPMKHPKKKPTRYQRAGRGAKQDPYVASIGKGGKGDKGEEVVPGAGEFNFSSGGEVQSRSKSRGVGIALRGHGRAIK